MQNKNRMDFFVLCAFKSNETLSFSLLPWTAYTCKSTKAWVDKRVEKWGHLWVQLYLWTLQSLDFDWNRDQPTADTSATSERTGSNAVDYIRVIFPNQQRGSNSNVTLTNTFLFILLMPFISILTGWVHIFHCIFALKIVSVHLHVLVAPFHKTYIRPSNHYPNCFFLLRITGVLDPVLAVTGWKAGYILNSHQSVSGLTQKDSHSHLHSQLRSPIDLINPINLSHACLWTVGRSRSTWRKLFKLSMAVTDFSLIK